MAFLHLKSTRKLESLAQSPIDLTKSGALSEKRIEKLCCSAVGLDLLYASERVTDEVIDSLVDLANEQSVLKKMASMQSGEILNRIEGCDSENRSVLHTAMRDQFEKRRVAPLAEKARDAATRELDKLEAFLGRIEEDRQITDLIQIGIGGSELGPRALYLSLLPYSLSHRRVHFISNIDPDEAAGILDALDLERCLVVVVSKSGSTLETATNEEFVRERFCQKGLDPRNHFVAVTEEHSPMDLPDRYLVSFYIWDFIGGRYSATSMVGGVLLGFALGFSGFREILRGAHAMDLHALQAPVAENLPLLAALFGVWNRNFLGIPTMAVIPYSQALSRFPAHLQQLEMESNGKSIDREGNVVDYATGPIVWGEPGTNGQHSFYQFLHQGTDVVALEFIGFRKSQRSCDLVVRETSSQEKLLANLFAQSIALSVGQKNANPNKMFLGNRPNRILLADRLDPFTMGALLAYYEHKVAFQGFIWDVNSFDQEGVQLGKVTANQILGLFAGSSRTFPLGEAYLKHLKKII